MRVPNVALVDIPQPVLVPQHEQSIRKVIQVEGAQPQILAELHQVRGLVLAPSEAPPALHLPFSYVHLLRQRQDLEGEILAFNKRFVHKQSVRS